jgi:hypothetical protein
VHPLAGHLDLAQPVVQGPEGVERGKLGTLAGQPVVGVEQQVVLPTEFAELDPGNELDSGRGHDRVVG